MYYNLTKNHNKNNLQLLSYDDFFKSSVLILLQNKKHSILQLSNGVFLKFG